ncbi:MAG: ornithine carbamoyltransferase [Lentisphaeria bacterium]|nr:ornithine carbamoyltransferase [Lentisphaeria bacterium]
MNKDFLTLQDIKQDEMWQIFELAAKMKKNRSCCDCKPLAGKSIGLIFAKSSTRTRVSFEVGVHELGGNPLYLDQGKMQLGRGSETVGDTAKVLSRYLHGIVIRTYAHAEVEELAREADIPVINALTNEYHPCQLLADLFTIYEKSGKLDRSVKVGFYGDGRSNIANSMILAARLSGIDLVVCAPEEERPDEKLMAGAPNVRWESDPKKAAKDLNYIYTDVWVSMGFEEEMARRMALFQPYQVNRAIFDLAAPDCKFLHCLPAHRGEEVSADVLDGECSIVYDEAENRLHVQKALMAKLIGKN